MTGGSSTSTSPNAVPDGTLFLADTTWEDPTVTDLDTLLFGPTVDPIDAPVIFGPGGIATIDTIGKSQNAYLGSGTWAFNTSTGHNEEIVAAPASQGLHAVVQHGVGYNGDKFNVPFTTTLGSLAVNPTSVTSNAADDGTGSFDVTVKSSLDLTGLQADAFGLSQPQSSIVHASQDDPSEADPSTASAKVTGIVIGDHASRATFTLPDVAPAEDIDLFVALDTPTGPQIVGSSTGPAGANESVTLIQPQAGTYEVWVYGFQVSDADHTAGNTVGIDIVQGNDLHGHGRARRPGAGEHPGHAARHLRERRRLGGPVRGRAAARARRGSDGCDGADHDQRRSRGGGQDDDHDDDHDDHDDRRLHDGGSDRAVASTAPEPQRGPPFGGPRRSGVPWDSDADRLLLSRRRGRRSAVGDGRGRRSEAGRAPRAGLAGGGCRHRVQARGEGDGQVRVRSGSGASRGVREPRRSASASRSAGSRSRGARAFS